jgi:hypothetical protein
MATSPNQTKSLSPNVQDARQQKTAPSHEAIEKTAYNIWCSEGQRPGCDQKNWFEAEKQLRAG